MITKDTLGKRIKLAMDANRLTQKELAAELQVTPAKISNYVTGKNFPSVDILGEMSKVLGVSTDWLLNIEGKEQKFTFAAYTQGDLAEMLFEMDESLDFSISFDPNVPFFMCSLSFDDGYGRGTTNNVSESFQQMLREWASIKQLSVSEDIVKTSLLPAWKEKWISVLKNYYVVKEEDGLLPFEGSSL